MLRRPNFLITSVALDSFSFFTVEEILMRALLAGCPRKDFKALKFVFSSRIPDNVFSKIRNNGINIATEAGSKVNAVFNGEVSRIFGITGGNIAVIIRHGEYLTVYSNLSKVIVKTGDKVTTKQEIGTVYTDLDEHKSVLKFQIWLENQKLDPEDWIGR